MDRKQFEARIAARAVRDEKFRAALKSDPRGVLAAELAALHPGATLPENVRVTVVEEAPDHICLVIPGATAALDDATLERVTAGAGEGPPPVYLSDAVYTAITEPVEVVASIAVAGFLGHS